MSTTTDAIRIVDRIANEKGMSRETATELIDFVESQRGDLVTKHDLKDVATKQDMTTAKQDIATAKQDIATAKQDIATAKQDIAIAKQDIAIIKQGQQWLKWVMIGGFTLITTFLTISSAVSIYLHSDTQVEMRELRKGQTELKAEVNELKIGMNELKTEMKEIKELLQKR